MNKKVFGRKLSRSRPAREALFATLSRALILSGKMVTTRAKAKAMQGEVEKMVTLAKKATLSGRRKVMSMLDNDGRTVDLLFQKIAGAFNARTSGYTRIVQLPSRRGDNAKMVRLEWTEKIELEDKKKEDKSDKSKKEVKSKSKIKKDSSLKSSNPKS